VYFLLCGLWPILSMDTFEHVTGPKIDVWLVKMIAAMEIVVGAILIEAAVRRRVVLEVGLLAAATCSVMAILDVTYVVRHVISPVYLGDAMIELLLLLGWARVALHRKTGP